MFLIAWMGGWVLGEVSALTTILNGDGGAFEVFWVAGWTVGGVFCVAIIFRLARPSRPERLALETLHLIHEPGTQRLVGFSKEDLTWDALELFKWQKTFKVAKKDVGDIKIDRVGERQRLSFDYGAKRIEVGQHLGEPEREWLHAVLKSWKSA